MKPITAVSDRITNPFTHLKSHALCNLSPSTEAALMIYEPNRVQMTDGQTTEMKLYSKYQICVGIFILIAESIMGSQITDNPIVYGFISRVLHF